jgi:hypothetical protein
MQINVLVEPMNGKGFRASGSAPFDIVAEGATRDEALAQLREKVQARMSGGAEVVTLDVDMTKHPIMKYAGIFKDNPLLEEWKQAMKEYRDEIEEDDNYL